jgi:hypothetical protein
MSRDSSVGITQFQVQASVGAGLLQQLQFLFPIVSSVNAGACAVDHVSLHTNIARTRTATATDS